MSEPVRMKLPPLTEKQIQSAGVKALGLLGFAVLNLSQPRATKQSPGLPDSLAIGYGYVAFIEWKRATGKQSPAQAAFQHAVETNGGTYCLFRSAAEAIEWGQRVRAGR